RTLRIPRPDPVGLRRHLHDLRHALHVGCGLRPLPWRPYPDGHFLSELELPDPGPRRRHALPLLLPSRHDPLLLDGAAGGAPVLGHPRSLGRQPLAATDLSVQIGNPARRHPASRAGNFRVSEKRLGSRTRAAAMSAEYLGIILLVGL